MKQPTKQFLTISLALSLVGFSGSPSLPSQEDILEEEDPSSTYLTLQSNSLLSVSEPQSPIVVARKMNVVITAYSSTVDQTDDTPFITASGTDVRPGIVAANFVPFGTKIRIPEVYGDKTFIVEDRMNPRKKYMVDIWFETRQEAKDFGAKWTYIEILEN